MNTNTPLDSAIRAADEITGGSGVARIATACGTSRQFIHKMRRQWRETGKPPRAMRDHAPAIEVACGKAVTVEALMPEVDWRRDETGAVVGYCVPVGPVTRIDAASAANDDAPPTGPRPAVGGP